MPPRAPPLTLLAGRAGSRRFEADLRRQAVLDEQRRLEEEAADDEARAAKAREMAAARQEAAHLAAGSGRAEAESEAASAAALERAEEEARRAGEGAGAGRARAQFDAAWARLHAIATRVHSGMTADMAARHHYFSGQLRRRAAELNLRAEDARRREWAAGDRAQSESRALLDRRVLQTATRDPSRSPPYGVALRCF